MKDLLLENKAEKDLLQALEVYFFDHKIDKWGICFTEQRSEGTWRAGGTIQVEGKDYDLLAELKEGKLEVKTEVITWIPELQEKAI